MTPSAGTFLWRTVAGTPRLSVYSFGAAIDLNVARSSYWAWSGYREGQRGITYRNAFPLKVVDVFERHGWIWGGRWYHHDTMHFEYRPELFAPGAIETDFGGGVVRDNAQLNAHISGLTAMGRAGRPDDVGAAVAALLADGNNWVTGQRIEVSGGMML